MYQPALHDNSDGDEGEDDGESDDADDDADDDTDDGADDNSNSDIDMEKQDGPSSEKDIHKRSVTNETGPDTGKCSNIYTMDWIDTWYFKRIPLHTCPVDKRLVVYGMEKIVLFISALWLNMSDVRCVEDEQLSWKFSTW